MSETIQYEEIRKGDRLRVEWTYRSNHYSIEGVAHKKGDSWADPGWYNDEGAMVTRRDRDQTIYLIERQLPELPTETGTLILAEMPLETLPLRLGVDGSWWYLNSESFYRPEHVRRRPWKLAKVVEA